jgi:hypothetical protein
MRKPTRVPCRFCQEGQIDSAIGIAFGQAAALAGLALAGVADGHVHTVNNGFAGLRVIHGDGALFALILARQNNNLVTFFQL